MSLPLELHRLLPSFLSAAQSENFSAAARQSGVTPAAISKNIRVLEEKLGLRLFARNTHSVVLTAEGKALLAQIQPLWQALSATLDSAASREGQPSGSVRVSVIPGFGQLMLMPLLPEFLGRYPQIHLDLSLEARVVNLVAEGFDVGIGNRVDPDSRLIARQLNPMRNILAASPAYLQQHGVPQTPDELAQHQCLLHRNPGNNQVVRWPLGESFTTRELQGRITASRPDLLIDAALAGLGIVCLAEWYINPHLQSGALRPVLEPHWQPGVPLWLYYGSADLPPRVRVWVEFLLHHFRG